MLFHYLKTSFREVSKHKIQSVINIIAMTIAFASFALSGYWHYWEHHFDTFHPEWEKTFAVTTTGLYKTPAGNEAELNQLPTADAGMLASLPGISKTTRMQLTWAWAEIKDSKQRMTGYLVDSMFFDVFHAEFINGNVFRIPYNGEYIVLTRNAAMRLFGTVKCLKEVINLNGSNEAIVVAVMENYPDNTELLFDYLVLTATEKVVNNRSRSAFFVTVDNKRDVEHLRKNIGQHKSISVDPYGSRQAERWSFNLRSLPELHFTCNHSLDERFRNIFILYVTGILLLVCALMNNLVLFIGQQQHKLHKNITYISQGETYTLAILRYIVSLLLPVLIAYILSFGLLEIIYPSFDNFTILGHEGVLLDYKNRMKLSHILTANIQQGGMVLLIYLLIGCIPVLSFMCIYRRKTTHPVAGMRKLLIAGQIFIGSIFLITCFCLFKQLHFLKHTPKGIETENVLQVFMGNNAPYEIDSDLLKGRLLQQPGVIDVTMTVDAVFLANGMFNHVDILGVEGRDIERLQEDNERDNMMIIESNFADFFGMNILRGRFIREAEEYTYVLNETSFKSIAMDDIFDRTVNGKGKVVGVINDYYYAPMKYPLSRVVYRLNFEETKKYNPFRYIYIKIAGESKMETFNSVKSIVNEFNKEELGETDQFAWLNDVQKSFNKPEETIFFLFAVFAVLCILISSFGIYSLVALSAEQRKREIAIRKVNGALFKDILRIFLNEYFKLALIGNAIALPLGYMFIHRWLETYAYRTEISPGLFIIVFLTTVLIVIAAVWGQIQKAVRENPANTIKSE